MLGEKCNDIEVPAETSEIFDGKHGAEVNGPYDLAHIITGRKTIKFKLYLEMCIFDKTILFIGSRIFVYEKSLQKWRNKDITGSMFTT